MPLGRGTGGLWAHVTDIAVLERAKAATVGGRVGTSGGEEGGLAGGGGRHLQ